MTFLAIFLFLLPLCLNLLVKLVFQTFHLLGLLLLLVLRALYVKVRVAFVACNVWHAHL